ncbi:unknown [Clostridium sp. CAG:356]|nr:unknown [Clostridium sp. CAG:356]
MAQSFPFFISKLSQKSLTKIYIKIIIRSGKL